VKDNGKAIEQYENILRDFPGNLLAVNNLASVLSLDSADKPKLERALALAKRLENSGQPVFLDTLAWIYYQLGDTEKALPLQLKVAEKLADLPIFQYHLGMIYSKRGDAQKARELLEKAVQSKNDFPGLQDAKDALRVMESSK
jgi:tetratricopeptide (TPR) repeat protein